MTTTLTSPNTKTLNVLIGARVRLTQDQRNKLKAAYRDALERHNPSATAILPGSTVKSSTSYNLNQSLGIDSYLFADIANSRESISLPSLLTLSQKLDVEIISKEEVLEACTSYVEYVWNKIENDV